MDADLRMLVIDDHVMLLQGLKKLLEVFAAGVDVDTADNLPLALKLMTSATYDVVLLDWHLPECTGEESIERIRESGCLGKIVVLSQEATPDLIRQSIEQGAAGFIPKRYSAEQMVAVLDQVLAGGAFVLPESVSSAGGRGIDSRSADADPRFAELTSRQVATYRAAARGLTNKLIARELGIAESTVKSHLAAVYAVLGVHNRTEAAFQATLELIRTT